MQCKHCWRYERVTKSCKSAMRYGCCGSAHTSGECSSQELCSCLCQKQHFAYSIACSACALYLSIIEIMGQRNFSRFEASYIIKQQSYGYTSAVTRGHYHLEAAFRKLLKSVVEKAMSKLMHRFLLAFTSSVVEVLFTNVVQGLQHIVPSMNLSMPKQTCTPFQASEVDSRTLSLTPPENRSMKTLMRLAHPRQEAKLP